MVSVRLLLPALPLVALGVIEAGRLLTQVKQLRELRKMRENMEDVLTVKVKEQDQGGGEEE